MAIKVYKPTTPGFRGRTGYTFEEITKDKPERSLVIIRREHAGRNANGKITVRHRGSGNRQYIRIVDFKREKHGIPANVAALSNMIPTGQPGLHYWFTLMAKNATLLLPLVSR